MIIDLRKSEKDFVEYLYNRLTQLQGQVANSEGEVGRITRSQIEEAVHDMIIDFEDEEQEARAERRIETGDTYGDDGNL